MQPTRTACKTEQTVTRRLFAARLHLIRNQERRRLQQGLQYLRTKRLQAKSAMRIAITALRVTLVLYCLYEAVRERSIFPPRKNPTKVKVPMPGH